MSIKQHFSRDPTWFTIETTASLLESTNGKDKFLKFVQYAIKLTIEVMKRLNEQRVFGHLSPQIMAKVALARIVAKQISTGRKLFRFGRSIYCLLMIRTLLEEKKHIFAGSWY